MPITLTGLRRYPIKSTRGEDLETALIEPWGLAGDRRWMVVDDDGEQVTAREVNPLLRIAPELSDGGVRLTAPGIEPLDVTAPTGPTRDVRIWDDAVPAAVASPEASRWLSTVLGRSLHLVYLDDPTRRPVGTDVSDPGDSVTFADAYPMLLASTSSLAQVNDWMTETAGEWVEPLDIRRFRPNLVVTGADPFAEDDWSRIRIGEAAFRIASDCSRCVMVTVDPDTIERGHEPTKTLARHRRRHGKVWFAVNLIPDSPGATLRVGDEVEVLAGGRSVDRG